MRDAVVLALVWSLTVPVVLALYSLVLLAAARLGRVGKVLLSVAAWLAVSFSAAGALVAIVAAATAPGGSGHNLAAAMGLWALAAAPGLLIWHRTFMARLRQAGYYLPRR